MPPQNFPDWEPPEAFPISVISTRICMLLFISHKHFIYHYLSTAATSLSHIPFAYHNHLVGIKNVYGAVTTANVRDSLKPSFLSMFLNVI